MLKNESLLVTYRKHKEMIENDFEAVNEISPSEVFDEQIRKEHLYKLVRQILKSYIEVDCGNDVLALYNFEDELFEYKQGMSSTPRILYCPYDVITAIRSGGVVKEDTFIAVSKTNHTIEIKPIHATTELTDLVVSTRGRGKYAEYTK